MAGGLIGALRVTLGIDASQFENGMRGVTRQARTMQRNLESIGRGVTRAGQTMSVAITLPFAALMRSAIPAAIRSREAMGQVEAALASMGSASGRTAQQLHQQAEALQAISSFDDDDILRKSTANLLTFGNLSGEIFDRTNLAVVNLSARLGQDLQSSALMVGKALNDPAKGLAALRRVGIQFTQQQQDQIKAMAAAGNMAGAQSVMLGELERQFGGSAQAMRDAAPGSDMQDAWREMQETVGAIALELLPTLTDFARDALNVFRAWNPETQKFAVYAAGIAAALGPVLLVIGPLISAMGTLIPWFAKLAAGSAAVGTGAGVAASGLARLVGFLGPVAAAAGAVYLVWKNWETIGPMLSRLADSIKEAVGPTVQAMMEGLRDAATELWEGPFGAMLVEVGAGLQRLGTFLVNVLGPPLMAILRGLGPAFATAFGAIADILNMIVSLLSGDFSGAWNSAKSLVTGVITGIGNVIEAMVPGAINWLKRLYEGVKHWLVTKLTQLVDLIMAPIRAIEGGFAWLYDRVVGNSYIPDMVDEIGQHMSRLDRLMVDPAQKATRSTSEAFREMASEIRTLLARLYPDVEAFRQLTHELGLLDKSGMTPDQIAEARSRLFLEGRDSMDVPHEELEGMRPRDILQSDAWEEELERLSDRIMVDAARALETNTQRIARAFTEMGEDVVGSLREMVNRIKKGDFLGALQTALGTVMDIMGALGHTPATSGFMRSGRALGFSTGGSFKVGGSGGVDSQLVRFRASPGEMVHVTRGDLASRPQTVVVRVVPNDDRFNAYVDGRASPLADNAAVRGAAGGAQIAQRHHYRRERSRLA